MIAMAPTHPAAVRARDLLRAGRPAGLCAWIAAQEYGRSVADVARALSARRGRRSPARVVAAKSESYWYDQI